MNTLQQTSFVISQNCIPSTDDFSGSGLPKLLGAKLLGGLTLTVFPFELASIPTVSQSI